MSSINEFNISFFTIIMRRRCKKKNYQQKGGEAFYLFLMDSDFFEKILYRKEV
jgi:hypothetical protein